jgi:hypothetical protein
MHDELRGRAPQKIEAGLHQFKQEERKVYQPAIDICRIAAAAF